MPERSKSDGAQSDLVRRADATRATMVRYRTRAFAWDKRATCIHMARFHLRQMGHRPPTIPDIRSPLSARRALLATGHDSLAELLDSLLPRITPAAMLVGDLALFEGDPESGGLDSIGVCAGDKLLGWHADDPSGIKPLIVSSFIGAWRA